ncbi:MAG: ABC transporter permease subunit [Nitrososphaerota archaeon]|nr:ABC transporter permease subunit [Nitrososphaerota archaeon]MDG6974189.1 ABC transporter permease subunit [Nitrososphaerota archaeon]MDG6975219.1 ABC transporter permease subunit [Nitrososphaerota archaeon]
MDMQNAWNVALKDFKTYSRKPSVIYATVALPLIVGVVFPLIVNYSLHRGVKELTAAAAPALMDSFSIWFLVGAAIIPTAIASYSLVGEKVQKSLEPMLATPMTDGDILLGKTLSSLLLPVASLYAGSISFMALMDYFTHGLLGRYYYPNWDIGAILLAAPFAALLSVEANVVISSRMTDVRSAQQSGALLMLPFVGLYLVSELGFFTLSDTNLVILAGVLAAISVAMFFMAKATFQREEILTRWR